jgi:hypothetical protein
MNPATIIKPLQIRDGTERTVGQPACPTCGENPCRSPSFCGACGDADARKARGENPQYTDASLWREPPRDFPALLHRSVSLERAWHELNRRDGAPAATTEALMFSLRERGVQTLSEPDTQRRLSELNDAQLREVAVRLQKLKAKIARAWTPKDVAVLIAARGRLK